MSINAKLLGGVCPKCERELARGILRYKNGAYIFDALYCKPCDWLWERPDALKMMKYSDVKNK